MCYRKAETQYRVVFGLRSYHDFVDEDTLTVSTLLFAILTIKLFQGQAKSKQNDVQ
jgi:hypothetical protein